MTELHLPLQTERLTLRAHQLTDLAALFLIHSRPDVSRYLLHEPWTADMAEGKIRERMLMTDLDGEAGFLALVIEHHGTVVGHIKLWFTDRERRVAEIGWALHPDHSGQGFAAEAASAVLDLAFDHYTLHRVAAQMDGRNVGSANVAARIGMRCEAYLRQDWWNKGEWTDSIIYGMLSTDRRGLRVEER